MSPWKMLNAAVEIAELHPLDQSTRLSAEPQLLVGGGRDLTLFCVFHFQSNITTAALALME